MRLKLLGVVVDAVLVLLERNVREADEEIGVLDHFHVAQMLLETARNGAGFRCHLRIEEVEAAFERALEQAAAVMAGAAGHVVCSDIRRGAFWCSQTNREAAGQVQQHFRHEVAGVTQRLLAFRLCLANQLVVGFLQKVFKCDQVFQVSHVQAPLVFFAFNN